ncbi:MAG: galactose oxidase [Bacteroidetes bacterium]|nr:galactose oxidase [Bacteroidota bacterium]MBS1930877.1 galactose oxidase [Bacteroidota bacterium]
MRKVFVYALGFSLIVTSVFLSQSCTKSTSSTSDLIGNWSRASDFDGNARSEAVCFTIGDYAYISTGTTDLTRFQDLWEYSIVKQYWSQKADLPGVARTSAVAFSIGTKGYVGTGFDGTNNLNDFWEYDQASNTWTQKDNFKGTARYDAVAFSLNNNGYVSCGFDGNYLKDLWQFDPTAPSGSQWVQKASIGGTKRSAAMSFVINGNAYVCSGNNNGTALNDLWMYDPVADTWTEKRQLTNVSTDSYDDTYTSIIRYNGVALVMNNLAYITTGENPSLTSTTWEYNPVTDLWTQKTGFEGSARTGAVAFTLNNRGFVMTGRSGSLSFDNCYEWHPNDPVNANDN